MSKIKLEGNRRTPLPLWPRISSSAIGFQHAVTAIQAATAAAQAGMAAIVLKSH